jgi:hypothetical protein
LQHDQFGTVSPGRKLRSEASGTVTVSGQSVR